LRQLRNDKWPVPAALRNFGVAILILVTGCSATWQPVPQILAGRSWTIDTADGWMRLATPTYEMLSLDGPYLQYVFIQELPLENGLRDSRQKLNEAMLPHEAAEVITDTMLSDQRIRMFKLIRNEPAMVGGKMGFRLVYTYEDDQGVAMKCDYYGVILSKTFFNVRYTAAERYYYEKDVNVFEKMTASLRFSDG
jgi:hypothetical protein